ncbi:MAG: zinc-ribbon domain-containing protein [Gemmatimonadota bacterium]|jgi:predicted Zn finger-like uncharacterized protein|nr:zinc-ribbon domain-containing protein [Gemmatimonadota bacterium]
MNVICPECQATYRVDPRKVPAGGVRARCSKCPAEFLVLPEVEEVIVPAAVIVEAPIEAPVENPVAEEQLASESADSEGYSVSDDPFADSIEASFEAGESGTEAADGDNSQGQDDPDNQEDGNYSGYSWSERVEVRLDTGSFSPTGFDGNGLGGGTPEADSFGNSEFDTEGVSPEDIGADCVEEAVETELTASDSVSGIGVAIEVEVVEPESSGSETSDADTDDSTDEVEPEVAPWRSFAEVAREAAAMEDAALTETGYGNAVADEPLADGVPADEALPNEDSERDSGEAADLMSDPVASEWSELSPAEPEQASSEESAASRAPVAAAVPDGSAAGLPPAPFGSNDPFVRARRLARALVSDIVVYNRDRREESIRVGTIRQEFRDEIRKSWDEYVSHVGEQVARDTPYFREALNELLAGGRQLF